jgi:hypothetical protein
VYPLPAVDDDGSSQGFVHRQPKLLLTMQWEEGALLAVVGYYFRTPCLLVRRHVRRGASSVQLALAIEREV